MRESWRALPPLTPEPATLPAMTLPEAMALLEANGCRPFSFVGPRGVALTFVVQRCGRVTTTYPWIGRAHYYEHGLR